MEISLRSGGYDIVAHGETFLFGKDKDLTIDVNVSSEFLFSVTLKFKEDSSGEQKMERVVSEDTLMISCTNFRDEGTGLLEPVRIARVEEKYLYFLFWSFVYGKERNVRSVRYTLFYGERKQGEAD